MKKYVHFVFFSLLSLPVFCQYTTFKKSFGSSQYNEAAYNMIQLQSKDFVVIGTTTQTSNGYSDVYCIKLDDNGNTLWGKTFGTTLKNEYPKGTATKDGGFILCFPSFQYYYNKALFIVKCDKGGNMLWTKCVQSIKPLDGGIDITPGIVYESKSGDIYVLSEWSSANASFAQFSLLKLDANGNYVWNTPVTQRVYLGYQNFYDGAVTETDNGDIVIARNGFGDDFYGFGEHPQIIRFSGETGALRGNQSVNQTYKDGFAYIAVYSLLAKDGRLAVEAGYSRGADNGACVFTLNPDSSGAYIPVILNNQGNTAAGKLTGRQNPLPNTVKKAFKQTEWRTKDGGYLYPFAGYGTSNNIIIEKFDSLGRICPDYIKDTTQRKVNLQKTMFYTSSEFYAVTTDTFTVVDTTVTQQNLLLVRVLCAGDAPEEVPSAKAAAITASSLQAGKSSFTLYPNPASQFITIHASLAQTTRLSVSIYSTDGKLITRLPERYAQGEASITLPVQNLAKGIYYASIEGADKPQRIMFYKQ